MVARHHDNALDPDGAKRLYRSGAFAAQFIGQQQGSDAAPVDGDKDAER